MVFQIEFSLPPFKRGYHIVTDVIIDKIKNNLPEKGLCNIFIKHTSAGVTINENADPTVRIDFENALNHTFKESFSYVHNYEGDDDMPAHLKSSVIGQSINIPISNRKLNLGTWQGIYLCEFRDHGGKRNIVITIIGE